MPDDIDPRKQRSRTRLLDAATTLLKSGGVQAVTIDAVTRMSKVARTTLYRNFENSADLLTATFERLVPPVESPPPGGELRDRLIELLARQSARIDEAPLQLATLAWLAMSTQHPTDQSRTVADLRERVIEHYREPFDRLLDEAEIHEELGDFDTGLAMAQLVGPMVFAKLAGLPSITRTECAQLADDWLTARRSSRET
ncbi:TetR/AcrR family transcriptional regulator [Nocardia acididurans]|uniref:TetR/AcrR family transcriptional regulator n=1 Tax=Nocardia acididurans TaxID=2802282 RepID=UPI0027DE7869|nr:TetR/AcrR family transcriptional regulator [Nocardia acididurans]